MPCPRIIFQACAARLKCFWLCLVLAHLTTLTGLWCRERQTLTVKQMGIRVLFSKRFCCCRTSNMSRHQLGQCSAHGPALNTGMPSAIDLKSDMHDMKTSARPFLCENWCHPALLDPSAWFLLGSHEQRYEFLVMRLAVHVYTGTWCGQCVNYCPRNLKMKGYYM